MPAAIWPKQGIAMAMLNEYNYNTKDMATRFEQ
jgi:hypothetical protein